MAANPERGEVDLMVGEDVYTLRPTMNALCAMQKRTGQTYGQLVAGLAALDMAALRELLFTFLQPYHKTQIKSLDQAGELIDAAGGHRAVIDVIGEVLRLNQQRETSKADGGEGAESDPRAAQAGSGARSGRTLGASA